MLCDHFSVKRRSSFHKTRLTNRWSLFFNNRKTNLYSIYIDSPEALLYLETDCWQGENRRFQQFKNLEGLRVSFWYEGILTDLERLKSLEIMGVYLHQTQLQAGLKYLVKQSKVLRRTDFKLIFNGVPIADGTELDNSPELLRLQLKNYPLLSGDLSFVTAMDYTNLMNLVRVNQFDGLPLDFFSKFFNLQKVTTSGPVDKNDFLNFLRKSVFLTELVLVNSGLNESLVDLPKVCNLKHLSVKEFGSKVDLDFILKFNCLESFKFAVLYKDNYRGSFHSLAILSFQKISALAHFEWSFVRGEQTEIVEITKKKETFNFMHCVTSNSSLNHRHGKECKKETVTGLDKLVALCVKEKYKNLDEGAWTKEIIYLIKFYNAKFV